MLAQTGGELDFDPWCDGLPARDAADHLRRRRARRRRALRAARRADGGGQQDARQARPRSSSDVHGARARVRRRGRAGQPRRPVRARRRPTSETKAERPGHALAVRAAGHAGVQRAARAGADREPSARGRVEDEIAARTRRPPRAWPRCLPAGLPPGGDAAVADDAAALARDDSRDASGTARPCPPGTQVLIVNLFDHRDRETASTTPTASRPRRGPTATAAEDWSFNHFSHGPQGCPGAGIALFVGTAMLAAVLLSSARPGAARARDRPGRAAAAHARLLRAAVRARARSSSALRLARRPRRRHAGAHRPAAGQRDGLRSS